MTAQEAARGALIAGLAVWLTPAAAAQIGSTYCSANTNSTGQVSCISATGSTDVTQNDVTLACGCLPANAFSYFLVSDTQGLSAMPGGSSGNLCLGGQIGRYAGNILNSGATGQVSLAIDLTSVAHPVASFAAMPGDTLNFQLWHRDSVGGAATSNFSEGLEITFNGGATPTFSADVYPMLDQPNIGAPACTSCHGGRCDLEMPNAAAAYADLINIVADCCDPDIRVIPGDATNSLLYQKLIGPSCGDQMPQGGTFAGDPNVIRDWILGGAPF